MVERDISEGVMGVVPLLQYLGDQKYNDMCLRAGGSAMVNGKRVPLTQLAE